MNNLLHLIAVLALLVPGGVQPKAAHPQLQQSCVQPPPGLVSWWPGEGNGNDIQDGNHGTSFNGTSFSTGMVGQAFSFDGIDDRINVSDAENLKLTDSLSIEAWIFVLSYPSGYEHGQILFRGDDRSFLDPYYLSIQPTGTIRLHIESQTSIVNLEAPVSVGQWIHVAGTLDGTTGLMRLYINGAVVAETTTSIRPFKDLDPTRNPSIGIGNHGGYPISPHNQPFHGYIDELSLYSRALSQQEIQSILTAGAAGKCKLPLTISHIEITQAIQDTANSVPLIAGKPTFVRVYVDCTANCGNVMGVLRGYGPGGELSGSPRQPVNLSITAPSGNWTDQRGDLKKTLNYTLPTQWTTGTITLTAQVATAQRSETKTFQGARSPRVAVLPVRYTYGGVDRSPDPATVQSGHWWATRVYPSPVDVVQLPGMTWKSCLGSSCNLLDQVIQPVSLLLQLRWQLDSYNSSRLLNDRYTYVFGWLPDGTFNGGAAKFVLSSAFGADLPSLGPDGLPLSPDHQPLGPKVFAHEVGHLLGRPHTKAGTTESCENPSPNEVSDWPSSYPDAKIQDWGLDGRTFGWLLASPSALKNPSETYDYMSYCYGPTKWGPALGQAWTSPHTYTSTFQVLRVGGASAAAETLSAPQPYLIASGLVYTDDVTALNPFWVITSTVAPVNPPSGTGYCLEAQNASGSTLASQCMDLTFTDDMGVPTGVDGFYIALAYPPGLSRIVFKKGSQEIAARFVSANVPVVTVSSPTSGEAWTASGTYTVSWTASDADNDPLTYQVLYSPDGINWVPVGTAITQTQIAINSAELAGGSTARIRVLASDGVNTTVADSASFSVGRKGPQAFILSPEGDGTIPPSAPLFLQGYAYDLEDGTLGENALQWSSNRDGNLGTGSTVLSSLSLGQHTVTLTATDSNGNTSSVSINVYVGYKVYLPLTLK